MSSQLQDIQEDDSSDSSPLDSSRPLINQELVSALGGSRADSGGPIQLRQDIKPYVQPSQPVLKGEENKETPSARVYLEDTKHFLPGEQIIIGPQYLGILQLHDLPRVALDENDYKKRCSFGELHTIKNEQTSFYRNNDQKGTMKNAYIKEINEKNKRFLSVVDKNNLEKLEMYTDRFPLLELRKQIEKFRIIIQMVCWEIQHSKPFENISICVICLNSAFMILDDPTAEPTDFQNAVENIFLGLYSVEMFVKICGLGFIMGSGAYLKDSWNILDFIIVVSSYPALFEDPTATDESSGSVSISGLRAFRVLRPLKTISSIKGLKVLMQALAQAVPLLQDTIAILFFFFVIYGIAGTNLMMGSLKNRCVHIQTGKIFPSEDPPFCANDRGCPGGYFCGKMNENPNYGSTNFDNIMYSILAVFQSVTLEGWSDCMKDVGLAYTSYIWAYFLPVVFIGAFFLINLLLAVINSEFTKAHKDHQAHELELKKKQSKKIMGYEEEVPKSKDELSMYQYINARVYAKKMIKFLKMRQLEKKLERERMEKIMKKQTLIAKMNRTTHEKAPKIKRSNTLKKELPPPVSSGRNMFSDNKLKDDVIPEELEDSKVKEESIDTSFERKVRIFLKDGKAHISAQSQLGKVLKKSEQFIKKEQMGILPPMKSNVGPTSRHFLVDEDEELNLQKKLFSKLAEEFDIDKILPDNGKGGEKKISPEDVDMESSFRLSINNDEIESQIAHSETLNPGPYRMMQGLKEIPGINNALGSDSGFITSDSNFEMAAGAGQGYDKNIQQSAGPERKPRKRVNIKKDVSKTFQKMLAQNHQRGTEIYSSRHDAESTKYGGSQKFDEVLCSEIESKFSKKKIRKSLKKKIFKEDLGESSFEREDKDIKPAFLKHELPKKEDIAQMREVFSIKRPKDPFRELNRFTQKVHLTEGISYSGTSVPDVFNQRIIDLRQKDMMSENKFLILPWQKTEPVDPDFAKIEVITSPFRPFQQKVEYRVEEDTSISQDSDELMDEDILFAQEQPYVTPTGIGFKPLLRQLPVQELAKRSDIMITSTLSMSIFSKDKREISQLKRACMKRKDIRQLVHEKNEFLALAKETIYKIGHTKDKDKKYRDNYLRSEIARENFQTATLRNFKNETKKLNSNLKFPQVKSDDQRKMENMKHEQNKRACQKRGLIKFDLENAIKLIDGEFHDQIEDDEEDKKGLTLAYKDEGQDPNKTVFAGSLEELKYQSQLEQFENQMKKILKGPIHKEPIFQQDEIPAEIRQSLNLPEQMGLYRINFKEVKKQDLSIKRLTPMWSGQDVLALQLNYEKSAKIIKIINRFRVWPLGIEGILKRLRYQLRILVKSSFFDSFMTFAVLLNTITLSIDHYGIEKSVTDILDYFNQYFTWIFIFEMGSKLFAIGVVKYVNDRMNWLDGGVVILSIIEMIAEAVLSGQGGGLGLSAFKTVRMLRTFRVFRIARLLRALQSMQIILGVMLRSYKSFIYITMLMFLFIFIFSLLGMQTFGGQFNYPDGVPRGNYDSFLNAFITTFQILTLENWQAVLFDSMRSENLNHYLVALFYICWIFLGNFILLNLFLAILLDSFLEEDEEEESEEAKAESKRIKTLKKLEKKKKEQMNKVIMFYPSQAKKNAAAEFFNSNQKQEEHEDLEDLDEEQTLSIFKDEGLIEKSQQEIDAQQPFQGIECNKAFYLFGKDNWFRLKAYKMIKHPYWERIVQILIGLSSLKLATDTYFLNEPPYSQIIHISNSIDFFFNVSFIYEMFFKLIAHGFIMDEGSYLRDSWNQLDFFIVMASIIDMAATGVDIPVIKILRMLRVLRPLRFINHNIQLKLIVVALLESVSHIFNVIIVIGVVFLIFAILGINFFGGKFFYCNIDTYRIQTEQECLMVLGQWQVYDFNFDNVVGAMSTLYVVSNLEAWPDFMIQAMDVTGIELGPTEMASQNNMFFFVIFILVGSFFFLNFFIGVLFLKFNQAQKEEQKGFSSKDLSWQDIQKMILAAEPEYESTNVPKVAWRKYFHELVTSQKFEMSIMTAIILNMIQMSLLHENQTNEFSWFLDFTNYIFTLIFIGEATCKIIGFGSSYFSNSWNKFDFFVVVSSIFDILLNFMQEIVGGENSFLTIGPQLARIMRVLRVTRVVRLAGKAEGLQAILQTIMFSIPSLSNIILLLMLIFFMFAILGNFLFNKVTRGDFIDDQLSYVTFDRAFLLLFVISTGENWPYYMQDCSRTKEQGCIDGETCGPAPYSYWYYYMMVISCSYVMLNLFILVIIQQFEKYYLPKENTIQLFKNDFTNFMKVWKKFTLEKYRCLKLKENDIQKFFRDLGDEDLDRNSSLGFSSEFFTDDELKKHILKMSIKSNNGYIYFNELLYRCMRNKYGNMKINKKMQIIELRTQYKIFEKTHALQNKMRKLTNEDVIQNIIKKDNNINPFLTIMNFRVSFKTWVKWARMRIKEQKVEEVDQSKKADHQDLNDSLIIESPENKKQFSVMIEIETIEWVTSDGEDSDEEPLLASENKSQLKSQTKSKSHTYQQQKPKKKNHLKVFEKKMLKRFKVMDDLKLQMELKHNKEMLKQQKK